jgi:D-ribose pyranose/furanose isomerase RbsD
MLHNKEDKEELKRLANILGHALESEGHTNASMAIMVDLSLPVVNKMFKGVPYNIVSLIKVLNMLGYQLNVSKVRAAKKISDYPEKVLKLEKHNLYYSNAKRKQRGKKPSNGETRIRVKKAPKSTVKFYSRRKQVEDWKTETDLFGPSSTGNGIS